MKMIWIVVVAFFMCCSILFISTVAEAQVPRKIAFQGALTDGDGRLLPNNQYDVVFRLYTQAEGGNSIWTSPTERVTLINGLFNVILGANPSDTAFARLNVARPLWLGVSVAGAEMPTRFEITSAMYAITAQVAQIAQLAERARKSDDGVPIGTVLPYMGDSTDLQNLQEDGWYLCDGRALSSLTDITPEQRQRLSNLLMRAGNPSSDSLPDLRGMFLRGANRGRTGNFTDPDATARIGAGQKIGSVQMDALQQHQHSRSYVGVQPGGGYAAQIGGGPWAGSNVDNARTSSETRPKNVYVNYIIKVK